MNFSLKQEREQFAGLRRGYTNVEITDVTKGVDFNTRSSAQKRLRINVTRWWIENYGRIQNQFLNIDY
jgi:hypothetical protein